MKRVNKLYEAIAIVSQSQRSIVRGLNGLNLNKQVRSELFGQVAAVDKELERLVEVLEYLLENETGLTEKQKWVNAQKNLGGSK